MFEIDLKSRKTICEQVVDKIRELIVVGIIEPDQKLPSVRDLSRTLTVNPNTVQKAFSELERLGYAYTVAGIGTFAARQEGAPDTALLNGAMTRLTEDVQELFLLGLGLDEIKGKLAETADRLDRQFEGRRTDRKPTIIERKHI